MAPDDTKSLSLRRQAVITAEVLVQSRRPKQADAYEGAINSQDELDAFHKTAHDMVLEGMVAADDPRAANLRTELANVLADARQGPANTIFKPVEFEQTANLYWGKLLDVVERERRAGLAHGDDLLKNLGVSQDVHFLQYRPEYGSNPFSNFVMHYYDVEAGGVKHTISFSGDDIRIEEMTDNWWVSAYRTADVNKPMEGAECDHVWSGMRKISLADIMDMSAFRLYPVRDISDQKNPFDTAKMAC